MPERLRVTGYCDKLALIKKGFITRNSASFLLWVLGLLREIIIIFPSKQLLEVKNKILKVSIITNITLDMDYLFTIVKLMQDRYSRRF